jgi:hypothetical protein
MGILGKPTDKDISFVECNRNGVNFVARGHRLDEYYFTRDEIETIARHMGLIPETVKKPLPSECKSREELLEHYKGKVVLVIGQDFTPMEACPECHGRINGLDGEGNSEDWQFLGCEWEWTTHEEPEQEAEEPAPPDITNEQHFAIWHSALVAAFREALRKGGGE